jgi:GTP-binding protein
MNVRNFAIIAHVDHGKTTLIDAILKQAGVFRENQSVAERVMDSNDQERERGITILSKNASYVYKGTKFNVVDTPGHADFGGEVERVLGMVDGVLLLVDAAEGPLPQTRFVLKNSLERGLKPLVLINKIDRPDQRAHEVHNEVLDLFLALEATDEQADFPCLYACAREGWAVDDPEKGPGKNLAILLDLLHDEIPAPKVDENGPLQMQISSIVYDNFVGRSGIGRVRRGVIRKNEQITLHTTGGPISRNVRRMEKGRASATTTEERRFPRKSASTATTRRSPCQSAVVTVPVARSTRPDCS